MPPVIEASLIATKPPKAFGYTSSEDTGCGSGPWSNREAGLKGQIVISDHIGQVICLDRRWCIERQIGAGGFGLVYGARSADGIAAVVKLIPREPGASRELLFIDLDGVPNVTPIIDKGEWHDYWVLVMPEAERTLRDYLNEMSGCLAPTDAVEVLVDITKALVAIEERVVHRDIKPENVLLLDGHWCLADFGISRYADATTAPDTRKHSKTYPYAAPEQWRGDRATSATDVYALGVVAYELLAGHPPFPGPEEHAFRRQHLEERPQSIPGIPTRLRSIVDECLYKVPEARPRPLNLLERWPLSVQPTSEAGYQLQQANARAVARKAEESRRRSVARADAERRSDLFTAAEQSFASILDWLADEIVQNASAAERSETQSAVWWSLGKARLGVEHLKLADVYRGDDDRQSPIEVIAHSSIVVQFPRDRFDYEGRSHALWYCNAQIESEYRWFETAFMISPFIPKRGILDPFALLPKQEAYGALAPIVDEYQVAWPFTPFDHGAQQEFIERWLTWFAAAEGGTLARPSTMPEQNPRGSWRQ